MFSKSFALVSLVLFLSPLFGTAKAVEICNSSISSNLNYTNAQVEFETKILEFAQSPKFAKEADGLLSKLISAKSPVIITWINKRDLQNKSDEEIIRAWRKYYALNFIIAKYPYKDSQMDIPIEFLFASFIKILQKDGFAEKMEVYFQRSQSAAIETIKKYKLEKSVETKIIDRISQIKLYWPKNLSHSKFKINPLEFFDWGIAYDSINNEINIGVHGLKYPNEETYLAVFAHEIAHSFDSCRWSAFFDGSWPFDKVGTCLRSPESVEAKRRDDSKIDDIQADQLPETFADWFSAETIANISPYNTANLRSDLCESVTLNPGSSYLGQRDRLEKIYLAHPKFSGLISTKQSIPSKVKYCIFGTN